VDALGSGSAQNAVSTAAPPPAGKTPGATALAFLLFPLFVDAAVETFWSGAPVRWWVVGAVAVFLAGGLAAWRVAPVRSHVTPAVLAKSSWGVFLALLAATVWLPGGLENGMRLAGQPTPVVLTLLTTCAVVLAGVVVLRVRSVPLWARLALAALAAYACAAFVMGLLRSTPYRALFNGWGFWSRLPVWLQGPRPGAFVVLPLGAIALALTWLKHRGEARTSTWGLRPGVPLLAAIAVSLAAVLAGGGANPANVAPGTVDPANRSSLWVGGETVSTTADLPTLLESIEATQPKMPRDRFDPAVIVDSASRDPERLMAWVRDNTRLVSYAGALRGALGVLMDRNGNTLDRSVLLARLLELAGFHARIVRARMPAAESAKVLAEARQPLPAAPPEDEAGVKWRRDLRAEASRVSQMILGKVGPLSLAPAAGESMHYWVQFEDGQAWVDLDPTLAAPRRRRVEPEGTPLVLDASTHGLARSSELLHSVKMSLLVERWETGKLIESPLLSVAFDSSKEPLASVTLSFVPVVQKKPVQRSFATGAELRGRLLTETAWAPVIATGNGSRQVARMFDDAGIVGDLATGRGVSTGAGDLFGGLFGGGEDEGEGTTVLTAVVAAYQIDTPGGATRRVSRVIFDSIGPEARRRSSTAAIPKPTWTDQQRLERGAELAALNDTLILFAGLPSDVYVYRFAQRAVDAKDATIKVSQGAADDATLERAADGMSRRTLEFYAASRDSSIHPELVVAEPQVVRRLIRYLPDANAKELDAQVTGDLASNRLSPASGSVTATAASAIVEQGVLDTLLESAIVLRDAPPLPGQTTAALFTEAGRQGIPAVGLGDPNDAALANYPVSARERMRLDLQAGFRVVAPSKPVVVDGQPRLGWWRVDPTSAQTVGEMDTGLLQDTIEYTYQEDRNSIQITHFKKIKTKDVDPRAREWAEWAIRKRGNTDWEQWRNLLKYASKCLDEMGTVYY